MRGFPPIVGKVVGHRLHLRRRRRANLYRYVMSYCFAPVKRHLIRGWVLGALLLSLAATAAGDPARRPPGKKHVAAAKQVASVPPQPTLALPAIPPLSQQPKYLRPFELDYATRLANSSTAAPPAFHAEPDVRPGAPAGPLNQAAQVASYGLLSSSVHPPAPPLVSIGDWNFSAAAHVPVTHGRDTGAAISAQHEF